MTGFQALVTGIAEHESTLERDYVTLCAFADPEAVVTSQPVTIRFQHEDQSRRYTPDFRVDWSDGHCDVVEIKYRTDLKVDWSRLRPAFAAARCWAAEHGAHFKVVTERGIRGPRLDNVKRLLPLRNAPVDAVLAERAVALARGPGIGFGSLADTLPASREAGLALIWRLIARGVLTVDLSSPVIASTRVTAP